MKYGFKILTKFMVIGLSSGFTECATDHGSSEMNGCDEIDVSFSLFIPAPFIPTRSMDGEPENTIKQADIIVFSVSSSTGDEYYLYHRKATVVSDEISALGEHIVTLSAKLATATGKFRIALIANASEHVEEALLGTDAVPEGAHKTLLLEKLQYSRPDKWNSDDSDFEVIPMYGESPVTTNISEGSNLSFPLIRMLARIDIHSATDDFYPEEIQLVNYNTSGYISPSWDSRGAIQSAFGDPELPEEWMSGGSHISYRVPQEQRPDYQGEIYTFETSANTAFLLIAGKITKGDYEKNSTQWFRVDFANGKASSMQEKFQYMPLLRNHKYIVTITAIDGFGYDSREDALNSLGIPNNLNTHIVAYDEGVLRNIVFNGQYYLGVENQELFIDDERTAVKNLVATSDPAGWKIDLDSGTDGVEYTEGGSDWLTWKITPVNQTSQGIIMKGYLELSPTPNPGLSARQATLYLKAGRLRHSIKIIQQ